MQKDEVIWEVLNNHFCSYKYKTNKVEFCRNEYSVTGMCNRTSCPLANSSYGTIMEHKGFCYLYLKTPERAHTPRYLWEKIKLSKIPTQAMLQIDKNMKGLHSKELIHRCKRRYLRIRQTLIRARRMELKPPMSQNVVVKKKTERREAARERKAEVAAKLDNAIENELLNRLKLGTYGDLYEMDKRSVVADEELERLRKDEEEYFAGLSQKGERSFFCKTIESEANEFVGTEYIEDSDDESELEEDEYEESDSEAESQEEHDEEDLEAEASSSASTAPSRGRRLWNTIGASTASLYAKKAPKLSIEYERVDQSSTNVY